MSKVTKEYVPVKPQELDFGEETIDKRLTQLLKEGLSTAEDFWEGLQDRACRSVQHIVEELLKQEACVLTGAEKGRHCLYRRAYRTGEHQRQLTTIFGTIGNLTVPELRKKPYRGWKALKAYGRHRGKIEELIREMFLGGISTRRIEEVAKPILGRSYSAQWVSGVLKGLDGEVQDFHERPLADTYRYLLFDGITLKVRCNGKVHKRRALVCYGITSEGKRELVDYVLAPGESTSAWESFIHGLHERGLKGSRLLMIATDGNQGLLSALELVYPSARIPHQRCWAHRLRNVANYCPKKLEKAVVNDARKIYLAESKPQARRAFKRFKSVWHPVVPKAVDCIQDTLEELLHFYDQPVELWRKLRTTNAIERAFREVRRRIRTISSFTNNDSCDRIIYGVMHHLNVQWEKKPLAEVAKLG